MTAENSPAAPAARFAATRLLLVRLALAFVLLSAAFQYLFHSSCAPKGWTTPYVINLH